MAAPNKILIARLSSIGDIILTTPVIRSVRKQYPGARISFLVKKEFSALVRYNPHIGEVIEFDKSAGFSALKEIRSRIVASGYDWFIDLHNNLRTNYIKRFSGISTVSSYSKQSFRRYLLVRFGKNAFREAKPVYLKYFEAVKDQGLSYDGLGTEVYFPAETMDEVLSMLGRDNLNTRDRICVLCPGASFSNKQWLPERFTELADSLSNDHGFNIVFLGGKQDAELCEGIIRIMKKTAVNYAGRLPLLGSAALLKLASLVITNDSGMMHMAQSQQTPVIAIFGPTTREMGFFPIPTKSIVVEKDVSCRPCTTKGLNYCPKKHFNCMKLIEAGDIMEAYSKLVK